MTTTTIKETDNGDVETVDDEGISPKWIVEVAAIVFGVLMVIFAMIRKFVFNFLKLFVYIYG